MQIYDLTLLYSCRNWMAVENTLPNDLDGLAKYLRTGRLRLILAKTSEWSWIDNSPSNSTVRHYVAQWHHGTITSYSMLLALPGEPIRVLYKQVPWHSSTVLQNMLTQHGVGVPKPKKNGCYFQLHMSQQLPTTNPREMPSCRLRNCSTYTL